MSAGPGRIGTIDAEGQTYLGSGVGSRVSSLKVQFESQSFTGEISIKGRAHRVEGFDTESDRTLLALAYKDDSTGALATAAITGNKSILVDSSGMDVYADCTSLATNSMDFTAIPLLG